MSKAPGKGDDRKNLFLLRDALVETGMTQSNARHIAEAISRMMNDKVSHAVGRHHSLCHKSPPAAGGG